jgi:hypothetical protein
MPYGHECQSQGRAEPLAGSVTLKNLLDTRTPAKKVMGIDASTKAIAYSIFQNRRPTVYELVPIVGGNIWEKCGDANKKMQALVKKHKPDYVLIERAIYVNNVEVMKLLAYVYGSVLAVPASQGIPTTDVSPTTWMNWIGNVPLTKVEKAAFAKKHKGRPKTWRDQRLRVERKQRTIDYVNKKWGLAVTDDNIADSLAIGEFAYVQLTKRA